MLQVYTWEPNSNAGKPIFALCEKGVPFEYKFINILNFDQHDPEYLKLNPAGTVPTMVHNGKIFTESTQLLEYIDSTFPQNPFMPKDPHERYLARWWAGHGAAWAASLSVLGWSGFFGPVLRQKDPGELKRLLERIPVKERRVMWSTAANATFTEDQLANARKGVQDGLLMMNKRLCETKAYFAGSTYSIADLCIFANCYSTHTMFPETANDKNTPYYMEWLRKIYSRPATPKAFAMGTKDGIAARIPKIMADLGVA
jgi:GSH-dependent disulfide-bond oxidoreductase